ncbi:MAG: lactonase family protein [Rikenellaceae bacterium]
MRSKVIAAFAAFAVFIASCKSHDVQTIVVGTATNGASEGVYSFVFDPATAKTEQKSVARIENPTFMAYDAATSVLYCVAECESDSAAVASFAIDRNTLEFAPISVQPCRSDYPCHIIKSDDFIATANYGGGDISIYGIAKESSGVIEPMSQRVELNGRGGRVRAQSHIHCLIESPDKRYIFATDLGKDSIYRFAVGEGATVTQLNPAVAIKRGSAPRHMTFAPNGTKAYLISEMSGEVTAFDYDSADGSLTQFQVVKADDAGGRGSADIHISSDGKYLYASNRIKDDGVSTFAIDDDSGRLTKIDYTRTGIHPRNFAISPCGRFMLVACRDSNVVEIYSRDIESGVLSHVGREHDIEIESPMFVKFI